MSRPSAMHGIIYFLAGAGLGVLAGVIWAPQSGEETRKMINKKVDRGREYVAEQRKVFRRTAENFVTQGRKKVEDLKGRARDYAERAGFAN